MPPFFSAPKRYYHLAESPAVTTVVSTTSTVGESTIAAAGATTAGAITAVVSVAFVVVSSVEEPHAVNPNTEITAKRRTLFMYFEFGLQI